MKIMIDDHDYLDFGNWSWLIMIDWLIGDHMMMIMNYDYEVWLVIYLIDYDNDHGWWLTDDNWSWMMTDNDTYSHRWSFIIDHDW